VSGTRLSGRPGSVLDPVHLDVLRRKWVTRLLHGRYLGAEPMTPLHLGARWRHVVVAALAAGCFAVTYAVGVLTIAGQSAEQTILSASQFTHNQPILNLVTVPNLLIACAVVAVLGLMRRRLSDAIAGVAIIGVSSVIAQVLKHDLLDRPALVSIGDNTFPSGHMTTF